MILDGNLLVHPRIVVVELTGMQIGCYLVPIATRPISPSLPIKDGQAIFLDNSANFQGDLSFLSVWWYTDHTPWS